MTRDEILNMPAGREMDALVWLALNGRKDEGLLTCRRVDGDIQPHSGNQSGHISPSYYSGGIGAAWEIVEKCKPNLFDFELSRDDEGWFCCWWEKGLDNWSPEYSQADTAPLAICRAFLLAVLK